MGYNALYIEMKRSNPRGTVKPHQRERMKRLAKYGNLCYVCWGDEAAWVVLHGYLHNLIINKVGDKRMERVG
jgi:hypothetical protein